MIHSVSKASSVAVSIDVEKLRVPKGRLNDLTLPTLKLALMYYCRPAVSRERQ
jgi:hypothetical protein